MKHLKRYIFLSALLALLICSIVFSVSATSDGTEVPSTYGINGSGTTVMPDSSYGDAIGPYEFLLQFGNSFTSQHSFSSQDTSWGHICDPYAEEFPYFVADDGYVLYIVSDTDAYYIFNSENQMITASDALVSGIYTLKLVFEFSFAEIDIVTLEVGETYSFSALLPYRTLGELAHEHVVFHHEVLGDCQFSYYNDLGAVVFRTNVTRTGKFDKQYFFIDPDTYEARNYESLHFLPGLYYGYEPCLGGAHSYGPYKTVSLPTCTDKGVYLWSCKYCDHVTNTYSDAFGHDLNILGNCKRCDYSRVGDALGNAGNALGNALGNAGNAIVDGWNNLFGAEDDEKKTLWDYITGLVPGGGSSGGSSSSEGGINTTLDGIARILSLGLVLVLGLVLFPLLKPLFQLLGDLISYGVSGAKSLSKKVKNKKKS